MAFENVQCPTCKAWFPGGTAHVCNDGLPMCLDPVPRIIEPDHSDTIVAALEEVRDRILFFQQEIGAKPSTFMVPVCRVESVFEQAIDKHRPKE